MVERLPYTQNVGGSIPSPSTNFVVCKPWAMQSLSNCANRKLQF